MENFNKLTSGQKEELADELEKANEGLVSLNLGDNTGAKKALLQLKAIKTNLERVREMTSLENFKYHLQARHELANELNLDYLGDFHGNLASGMRISEDKIHNMEDNVEDWFLVNLEKREIVNEEPLEKIYEIREGYAKVKFPNARRTSNFNLMDEDGNVFWLSNTGEKIQTFSEGFALIPEFDGHSTWLRFRNKRGEFPFGEFLDARPFKEGFAAVQLKNGKWTFMDKNGNYLKNIGVFDEVQDFTEGYASVCVANEWVSIDKFGKIMFSRKRFKQMGSFKNGLLMVSEATSGEGSAYLLDAEGNEYFNNGQYQDFILSEEGPIIAMTILPIEVHFLDRNGERLFPEIDIVLVDKFRDGVLMVQPSANKFKYLNTKGEFLNNGEVYDLDSEAFHEGVAKVVKDGETYYIDVNGNRIFN